MKSKGGVQFLWGGLIQVYLFIQDLSRTFAHATYDKSAILLKPVSTKSLEEVLHYFDFFNHALAAEEILRYIAVPASLSKVKEGLQLLTMEGLVYEKQGWFALDSASLELRIKHEQLNQKRLKLARRVGRFIALFPFVRGVYLSGSLSKSGVQSKDDDLDFFILTASNRVWTTKFFLIAFKKTFLLNSEKYFCINLLMDENRLSLAKRNRYTATEVVSLVALKNTAGLERFLQANHWVKDYFPNVALPEKRAVEQESLTMLERILDRLLGGAFEQWCKERFTNHMRTHTDLEEGYFEAEAHSSAYFPQSVEQRLLKHLENFGNE